jgi:excisionase family DNA binding protein
MEQYLTIKQAARLVQCSERTIRRWIDDGKLPAVRVGKKFVRVSEADLQKIMQPISL